MGQWLAWLERGDRRSAALEVWDGGRRLRRSGPELAAIGRGVARRLARRGLAPGHVLAIGARDPGTVAVGVLAAWACGAVACPVDVRLPPVELAALLGHAGARVALTDGAHARDFAACGLATEVVGPRWPRAGSAPCRVGGASGAGDEDRPALLVYSSGTTAQPKGVLLSHGALAHSARAVARRLRLRRGERWLAPLRMHHVGGLSVLLRCWRAGATPVLAAPGADTLATLAQSRAGLVSIVPTQLARWLDAGCSPPRALRVALVGGGALAGALRDRAIAGGWPLAVTYGLTESASQATCTAPHIAEGEDGSGVPIDSVRVRIARPDADGTGEIELAGPVVMTEYWRDPTRTAAALDHGWLATGDLGRIDAAGRLIVAGRADDVVRTGGESVHPAEVEAALLALPEVAAACVVGVPSAEWGERVAAAIVLRSAIDDADLLAALGQRLARHKLPRLLVRLAELPLTGTGKIARRAVRDLLAAPARIGGRLDEIGQSSDNRPTQ